jgi:hypothetical protein
MKENTTDLLRYVAGGIGMLIFVGMLAWCTVEEARIKNPPQKSCVCDCETTK